MPVVRVTVDGTMFPPVDFDDLELGEMETLEAVGGLEFDEDGKLKGRSMGFTVAAVYIAWRRVDPAVTLQQVRRLKQKQFNVETVDDADPQPAAGPAGGEVVTLAPTGSPPTGNSPESDPGSSTASGAAN